VLSLRFTHVWRRNFRVWRKLAIPSMLGNLADPMLYMLGLGYGLGAFVGEVGGVPYITFLAAGTVCYSTMNTATFEALYSAFSRMHVQKTWDAIMNAPLNLDDVIAAEAVWAASKSFLSGCAILIIIWALGLSHSPLTLWIVPLAFLIGLTFACLGLVMNSVAPSYDRRLFSDRPVARAPASPVLDPAADPCRATGPAAGHRNRAGATAAPRAGTAGLCRRRLLCCPCTDAPAAAYLRKSRCSGSSPFTSFSW
jgi:Nod factor-specific ABC transporter NodJ protein